MLLSTHAYVHIQTQPCMLRTSLMNRVTLIWIYSRISYGGSVFPGDPVE